MSRNLVTRLMAVPWVRRGRSPAITSPLGQRAPEDRRNVVLTSLLLADQAALDRVAVQASRHPRLRMIVATDSDRIAPLRDAGAIVEHFPAPAMVRGFAAPGDWAAYLRRRWTLVLTKWEPALVRQDGVPFDRYLEACGLVPPRPTREPEQGHVLATEAN